MANDEIIAIAHEIDTLINLQTETLQPAKLKEISAAQLREYETRRGRIKQLCDQLEKIGHGD
jgi:hypothetical protein